MSSQQPKIEILPMPPISWGDDFYKDVCLLKITTKDGLIGLGGAYTSSDHLSRVIKKYGSQIDFSKLDLAQVSQIVDQLCAAGEHVKDPELIPALSALDIALWDLYGQATQQSIAQMIGGLTDPRIKAYASLEIPLPRNQQDFSDFHGYLQSMLDQNFKAIKLYFPRLGYREYRYIGDHASAWSEKQWDDYEASLFQRARDVVGPDIDLMLDVFGSASDWQGNMEWAEQTASLLQQQGFLWFEEPFRPDDMTSYKALGKKTSIALSACEFFTDPKELKRWAKEKAVSILQPDCTCGGGVSTLVQVRDAAIASGATLIPHGWSTAVGMAADIQVMGTVKQGPLRMVEYMPRPSVTQLLKDDPFRLDDEGMITIRTTPGLGVELAQK